MKTNLLFWNQAASFLEKLMGKVTGIAADVVRPAPKFIISDEEYLKVRQWKILIDVTEN